MAANSIALSSVISLAILMAPSFCLPAMDQTAQQTPHSTAPPWSNWFAANDRVEVVPPPKLVLAEPNEISLRVQTPGLTTVSSNQRQYYFQKFSQRQEHDNLGDEPSEMVEGGSQILPVLHRADGSAYINVVPRRLGKMYLYLSGYFPDGGTFHTELVVDVEPPQRPPESIVVGPGGNNGRSSPLMFLHLDRPDRDSLNVYAIYENVKEKLAINASFVTFKVRESPHAPAFDLDETTGTLTPLRLGHALVETSYGGHKMLTCVVVRQDFGLQHSDHSRCEELLEPGEALAPFE